MDLLKTGVKRDTVASLKFEGSKSNPSLDPFLKRMWIRDFVRNYLEKNWYMYDIDRNESMDHHEAYEFFIDLVPKTSFEKLGYAKVFEDQNTKGDE